MKFECEENEEKSYIFVQKSESVMGTEMKIQDGHNGDYMIALNE